MNLNRKRRNWNVELRTLKQQKNIHTNNEYDLSEMEKVVDPYTSQLFCQIWIHDEVLR